MSSPLQTVLDQLKAEFPHHHLEVKLFPSGGMIDAEPCEECGSTKWGSASWKYGINNGSIDLAVEKLKRNLADSAGGEGNV